MFPTVEVRWFYAGPIPTEVLEWFQWEAWTPEDQPYRVDRYLRLEGMRSLGIKLREGRLELKQRHRSYGIVHFDERISGFVESWRKWSFGTTESGARLDILLAPDSSWIDVQKERKLRRYQLAKDGWVVSDLERYPPQGCNLELTSIMIGQRPWYSLGLEAFGDEGRLVEDLHTVAQHALVQGAAPTLSHKDSYSYPAWLETVVCADDEQA